MYKILSSLRAGAWSFSSLYPLALPLAHSRHSCCGVKAIQSVGILRHTAVLAALSQQEEHVCSFKQANSAPVGSRWMGLPRRMREAHGPGMKAGMREGPFFVTKKPSFILQLGKQNNISRTESNLHDKLRELPSSRACKELH